MYHLQLLRENLKKTRYYTHRILPLWKITLFFICVLISLQVQGDNAFSFFELTRDAFGERLYVVNEVLIVL